MGETNTDSGRNRKPVHIRQIKSHVFTLVTKQASVFLTISSPRFDLNRPKNRGLQWSSLELTMLPATI